MFFGIGKARGVAQADGPGDEVGTAPNGEELRQPDAPSPKTKKKNPILRWLPPKIVAPLLGLGSFFVGVNVSQHRGVPLELIPGAHAITVVDETDSSDASDAERAALIAELRESIDRQIEAGTPGGAVAVSITQQLVDHHGSDPRLDDQERFDAVMEDLTTLMVGQRFVETIDDIPIFPMSFPSSPRTAAMRDHVARMSDLLGTQTSTIDPTNGADLKEEYRDGTNSQLEHTFFYVALSYGQGGTRWSKLGAVQHELVDPWGGWGDMKVGLAGSDLGATIRRLRDEHRSEAFHSLPTLIAGFLLEDPSPHGDAALRIGEHFEAREQGDGFLEAVWNALHLER